MMKKRKLISGAQHVDSVGLGNSIEMTERLVDIAAGYEADVEATIADSGRARAPGISLASYLWSFMRACVISTEFADILLKQRSLSPRKELNQPTFASPFFLSPTEAHTQIYNIRGPTQIPPLLVPSNQNDEGTLHEFIDPPSNNVPAKVISMTPEAEEVSSTDTLIDCDDNLHRTTVSDITMPLSYRTLVNNVHPLPPLVEPIRQERHRYIRRNGSVAVLPDRNTDFHAANSSSTARRLDSETRSATELLLASPPFESQFGFVFVRGQDSPIDHSTSPSVRRLDSVATRRFRHNENVENEPIEWNNDRTVVSADASSALARARAMQLREEVGRWRRNLSQQRINGSSDHRNGGTTDPLYGAQATPRLASSNQIGFQDSRPIRTEIPRLDIVNSVGASLEEACDDSNPLGSIDSNRFVVPYRHDLLRSDSVGSSIVTAPGTDEHDRDIVMESSSPLANSHGGSDLVTDMDNFQLDVDDSLKGKGDDEAVSRGKDLQAAATKLSYPMTASANRK
ncbi:hypothetical protein NliqN6_4579 [Naganishia liquefaciens]|uniref:Uncharacterized protein n=1 Tax=Naganishia liquefaciens TaxID=104408 RepID=A0A8H3TW20_9TREE|nr:hypothetical protein NliqN6_4579 [Naganishia liquefaciens]